MTPSIWRTELDFKKTLVELLGYTRVSARCYAKLQIFAILYVYVDDWGGEAMDAV